MKLNTSMLLMCCMLLAACLPSPPAETVVIERSCFIDPLPPKQSLPPVRYLHLENAGVEYLCLDPENQAADKERELRLRQDARICQEAYQRVIDRCVKEK